MTGNTRAPGKERQKRSVRGCDRHTSTGRDDKHMQTDMAGLKVGPKRAVVAHHFGKEAERFQVFQNVAVLGCDEHHVQLLHGLIHIPHGI